jgi:hypothetical protein
MLDFLSIRIPDQFHSHWSRVHLTAERILVANQTILNYWIHIRRDDFYHRFFRSKNNDWINLLTSSTDISVNDIYQIYQFIRTSIHVIINNDNSSSSYYAQTKQNENDNETTIISLSDRLFQSDTNAVSIIDYLLNYSINSQMLHRRNSFFRECRIFGSFHFSLSNVN